MYINVLFRKILVIFYCAIEQLIYESHRKLDKIINIIINRKGGNLN